MKIIIVGAGKTGINLSKSLAQENNEVYLIEQDKEIVKKIAEKLDVKVIVGNGADPTSLQKAMVGEADLVLALTTTDETNLVVCSLAATFGAKRRIARVRNTSLRSTITEHGYSKFNVDEIINPELLAAEAIVKMIETPGASEVGEFAQGKILLRGFDIPKASSLCGSKLIDLGEEDFPWPFLVVSIIRNEEVFIPKGETTIQENDHIYVLLPPHSVPEFVSYVNPEINLPKKVIIYGATITGLQVATILSSKIKNIILLEENAEKAQEIAAMLDTVRIINGSACDADILTESGMEAADVFVATSDQDHSNLISSVLAKKMGAKSTIIMTQQPEYMAIVDNLKIDAIVNPHYLAVEQILHLARGRGIHSITKLLECDAEAMELTPESGSAITKGTLKELKLPKNLIVGAVYIGDEINLANGNTKINEGERVIVFCHSSALKKIQALFTN